MGVRYSPPINYVFVVWEYAKSSLGGVVFELHSVE